MSNDPTPAPSDRPQLVDPSGHPLYPTPADHLAQRLNEDRDRLIAVQNDTRRTNFWMRVFTGLLAAVGALGLYFNHKTLKEIHASGADTHALAVAANTQAQNTAQQLLKMEASITAQERMAKATEDAVGQAKNSIEETVRQFHLDQRAWLGLSDFEILHYDPLDPKTPFRMQVFFRNSGKTPALNVKIAGRLLVVGSVLAGPPQAAIDEVANSLKNLDQSYIAAPQATRRVIVKDEGIGRNMVTSNYQAIKDRRAFFYYYGQINYEDVYRRPHTTSFCLWLVEPENKQLVHCEKDNTMD